MKNQSKEWKNFGLLTNRPKGGKADCDEGWGLTEGPEKEMILAPCWTFLLYGIVNSMATLSPFRTLHVSPLHAKEFFFFKKLLRTRLRRKMIVEHLESLCWWTSIVILYSAWSVMKSLEASEQKANCGGAINNLAFPVYMRIWILSTKGKSSAQIGYEWQ